MIWAFYLLQILVIAALVVIIMLQKSGDGIFSPGVKAFGIRGRSNMVIKVTYGLGIAFLIINLALSVLYKKQFKKEMITENKDKITLVQNVRTQENGGTLEKDSLQKVQKNLEIVKNGKVDGSK